MKRDTALTLFNLCNSAVIFSAFGLYHIYANHHDMAYVMFGFAITEVLITSIILGIELFKKFNLK